MTSDTPAVSPRVYFWMQRLFKLLAWCLTRLEVSGVENIPAEGPLLLVVNHLSIADPPIVFVNFPRQCVMFVTDKYRQTPIISHIANTAGVIWVARGEADRDALRAAINHLKSGGILGIAPEGMRSPMGGLQRGKAGPAYLADRARVPILPVAVMGTQEIGRNLKRLRRTPVKFVVGKVFQLPSDGRAKAERLGELTDLIMCHIAVLLEPQYRGVYADHPLLRELLARSQAPASGA